MAALTHSHIDHLMAILDVAAANGATRIAVHAVLDGRDKPPRSALGSSIGLEAKLKQLGRGRIATNHRALLCDGLATSDGSESSGRGAAMVGGGRHRGVRARARRSEKSYAAGKSDEFVEPHVNRRARAGWRTRRDEVICFNFRADRRRRMPDGPQSRSTEISRVSAVRASQGSATCADE